MSARSGLPAWNVVLQFMTGPGVSPASSSCKRFAIAGLQRPIRILFLPCHPSAVPMALAAHDILDAQLTARGVAMPYFCGVARTGDCMAWSEPACEQVLVPVIGADLAAPAQPHGGASNAADFIVDWLACGPMARLLPAVMPGVSTGSALAKVPLQASRANAVPWGGSPQHLAAIAFRWQRRSAFLSYRRQDAAPVADQIFDGLGRAGYRTYVDRFCGTAGSYFPDELAEELADKDVVVVLESANIRKSTWTMWEVAFAHRYRIGVVAIQLPGAPALKRITDRKSIATLNRSNQLFGADLDDVIEFIALNTALGTPRRAAFYEAIVASAASSGGGSSQSLGDGLLQVVDRKGVSKAVVLAHGRPGILSDVRRLDVPAAQATGVTPLLVGQHEHLPATAADDLKWIAGQRGISLRGRFDTYMHVKNLC